MAPRYLENLCIPAPKLTYLLTPWSRVLLEKLTGLQLVNKFPAFYGTRRFITALTSARHLSLSWASSNQSTHPHPTSQRSILYYPPIYAWVSPVVSFPQVSPPKPCTHLSPPPYACVNTVVIFTNNEQHERRQSVFFHMLRSATDIRCST